ncbi:hypothetical protein [Chitinophaga rhizophila]|uniref:Immunity protein 30 of polymorphic toxin system n=1 Tax=Chitinophaga rhizophila TaxID=2866212 RepID=A0ABS7GI89_9BACT|nr:hypothetical protein [Chitinophaga rhizophila]MBW8687412.1 hypothetical protein [Chitinophaga rhizophila]
MFNAQIRNNSMMTTDEVIQALNSFVPEERSADDNISYFHELMEALKHDADRERAIEPIFRLIERHPHIDYGSPGPLAHTLESFHELYHEHLFASLDRLPTPLTVWMLNRLTNADQNYLEHKMLIEKMHALLQHPRLDDLTRGAVEDFVDFQDHPGEE